LPLGTVDVSNSLPNILELRGSKFVGMFFRYGIAQLVEGISNDTLRIIHDHEKYGICNNEMTRGREKKIAKLKVRLQIVELL